MGNFYSKVIFLPKIFYTTKITRQIYLLKVKCHLSCKCHTNNSALNRDGTKQRTFTLKGIDKIGASKLTSDRSRQGYKRINYINRS